MSIGRSIRNSGEWAVDEVKVKVINFSHARIYFRQYVVNAPTDYVDVKLRWYEKRKGIKLEDKIQIRMSELKLDLQKKNHYIRRQKHIEELFNSQ